MKKIKFLLLCFVIVVFMLCGCEGKHINEFVKKGNDTYYYDENGKKVVDQIIAIDGTKYCFDEKGKMFKGLYEKGEERFYFDDENGQMVTDSIKQVDGYTYNFNEKGKGIWKLENIWSKKYFVDEFGDKTNEWYIANKPFEGTFSNSATSNSECLFQFMISKQGVYLNIYEYGDIRLKGNNKEYKITIRKYEKKSGETNDIEFVGVLFSDRIKLYDKFYYDYNIEEAPEHAKYNMLRIDSFHEGDEYKCYIEEKRDYGIPSTYNFDIIAGDLTLILLDNKNEIFQLD